MNNKMKKNLKTVLSVIIIVLALVAAYKNKDLFVNSNQPAETTVATGMTENDDVAATTGGVNESVAEKSEVVETGEYTTKEDVAAYIHTFKHLPSNFITKGEAKQLGWISSEGNLWEVAPDKSIGGDYFGNNEGLLPEKDGREYFECDIDFEGEYRNAKRIVYSNDGLIYYTEDHYESFECLYGEE